MTTRQKIECDEVYDMKYDDQLTTTILDYVKRLIDYEYMTNNSAYKAHTNNCDMLRSILTLMIDIKYDTKMSIFTNTIDVLLSKAYAYNYEIFCQNLDR